MERFEAAKLVTNFGVQKTYLAQEFGPTCPQLNGKLFIRGRQPCIFQQFKLVLMHTHIADFLLLQIANPCSLMVVSVRLLTPKL